jgi:hypothetical protein
MTSVFDLKTSADELASSNQGTSRLQYDEQPPTRDITGKNFSNGAIHFKFENSGQKWWMPSKSYIKTRLKLTKSDGTMLELADGIAPNMDLCPNLFQSCEFRIQDKVISRVADFLPQVDALETRLAKSKSWLDSVGVATDFWQADQSLRLQSVIRTGSVYDGNVPAVQAGTITARGSAGFYDAVGAVAASNHAEYVAATGIVTFVKSAGGAVLPDANLVWTAGDFFAFRGVADAGVNNVQMKVISVDSATQITVESILTTNRDGTADPTEDFYKATGSSIIDAPPSRRVSNFEAVWQPPLSIFKVEHALPCGKYELVLNPQTATAWKQRAIESVLGTASKAPGAGGQFDIEIVDMYMYVQTLDGPRTDDMSYLLDLEQTRCQAEKIDNSSFGQKNADISPSTFAITVAYQDSRAGEHTSISASKFKSYDDAVNPTASQELLLTRQFLNYAGQNFPAPDANPEFVPAVGATGGIDYTTQGYVRSQIYSGGFYDSGGSETLKEWQDRGSYYYHSVSRDGSDRSTRLNVHSGFAAGTQVTNLRLLMFDHSRMVARVRIQDGRVVDVQLEDA